MRVFCNILTACTVLTAFAPHRAYAVPLTPFTGQISITGNDTFDRVAKTITFLGSSPQGLVGQVPTAGISTTLAAYFTTGNPVTLISGFSYTAGPYGGADPIFSITEANETLKYFLTAISFGGVDGLGDLTIKGTGYFTETGAVDYAQNDATFNLTSDPGISSQISFSDTSYALPPAVTPEPSSLLLLGTSLIGAASMTLRKRTVETTRSRNSLE